MEIEEAPSPNFGPRRDGVRPSLVVLHYTAMPTAEAALARLRDPLAEVSAHYLIAEDGRAWRLMAETERAWHAGVGTWGRMSDVNSRSIGIELANGGPVAGFPPFPEPQMAVLEQLLDGVMARWGILADAVIAHSDMAPGRKADPGRKFDWRRLALGGRSIWPAAEVAAGGGWDAFLSAAEKLGYGVGDSDREAVLEAFRLRFRPAASGELRPEDVGVIELALTAGGFAHKRVRRGRPDGRGP